jgi:hypothetical protein
MHLVAAFRRRRRRTLQTRLPGRYKDLLRAGEHYAVLRQDFSTIAEVLDTLRSLPTQQRIVDAAQEHVMGAHTGEHRLAQLAAALEKEAVTTTARAMTG